MNKQKLIGSSKLTSKGQITIPQEIREKYHMNTGTRIYFLQEENKLILKTEIEIG